jgi:hypothetical protein
MKKTYEFWAGTRYINSTVKERIEIEFDDNATEIDIDNTVDSIFNDWLPNNIDSGYNEV